MSYNSNERENTIVIVGGGLAGLTAAIYLARAGCRVMLFEKAQDVGGRARTRQQDQFLFNLGPHALYQGAEAQEVLDDLGISLRGGMPQTMGALLMHENSLYPIPADPVSFMRYDLLGVRERLALVPLLLKAVRTEPSTVAHHSFEGWLGRQTESEGVRNLLRMLMRVGTYCNAGHALSAEIFLRQFQLGLRHGVLYLDGGWQTLVDALYGKARAAGVHIETECRVERVTATAGGPTVTLGDGRVMHAPTVVLAVGPNRAQQLLPQDEALTRAVSDMRPVRAATLDVALRRLPRPERPLVLGLEEPLYLSVHSAVAELAPPGGALVHLAKYLNHDAEAESAEQELEALLDLAQPGWQHELVNRRFVPHLTVVHDLVVPPAGLRGRPDSDLPDTPGVFLAGDWVGPQGWLSDAAFASARTAARLALQHRPQRLNSRPVRQPAHVYP